MKSFYVYIMASKRNGTLYTGVTNDIARRAYEHKMDINECFTKRYKVHILVYFEEYDSIEDAIWREKCIKRWKRNWKIKLIEEDNPNWIDLYDELS